MRWQQPQTLGARVSAEGKVNIIDKKGQRSFIPGLLTSEVSDDFYFFIQ